MGERGKDKFRDTPVTYRKIDEDGDYQRVSEALMTVEFNPVTGRYNVPVYLQEGINVVVVRLDDEEKILKLTVDVHRSRDGEAECTDEKHRAFRSLTMYRFCPHCGKEV